MNQTQDTKARDEGLRRLQTEKDVLAKLQAQEPALVTLQTEIRAQLDKAQSAACANLAQARPDELVKLAMQRAKADYEVQGLEDSLQEVIRRHKELQDSINAQIRNVESAEVAVENAGILLQINEILPQLERMLPPIQGLLDASRALQRRGNHALPGNRVLWILGRLEALQQPIEKVLEIAADSSLDM